MVIASVKENKRYFVLSRLILQEEQCTGSGHAFSL